EKEGSLLVEGSQATFGYLFSHGSLDTILKFFKSIYVTQNEKLLCMSIHNNITMVKLHDRHLNLVKRVHNNFAITYIQGCL
ncbi:hypothetical protein ACI1VO_30125, partial [Escherichia coli]|uniref:hypothetical protein n=1 Tax=Escherichia coli TaxID=562 RepID=UPI00384EC9CE